mmetsp:Transcript_18652/g.37417  ORF Transcript_18652/g.37417 Transcript_18652/m.37417 type:complete len:230 (+) Transcript_18652:1501-2190(+)
MRCRWRRDPTFWCLHLRARADASGRPSRHARRSPEVKYTVHAPLADLSRSARSDSLSSLRQASKEAKKRVQAAMRRWGLKGVKASWKAAAYLPIAAREAVAVAASESSRASPGRRWTRSSVRSFLPPPSVPSLALADAARERRLESVRAEMVKSGWAKASTRAGGTGGGRKFLRAKPWMAAAPHLRLSLTASTLARPRRALSTLRALCSSARERASETLRSRGGGSEPA